MEVGYASMRDQKGGELLKLSRGFSFIYLKYFNYGFTQDLV